MEEGGFALTVQQLKADGSHRQDLCNVIQGRIVLFEFFVFFQKILIKYDSWSSPRSVDPESLGIEQVIFHPE
jgi:hypothetical protein